MKPGAFIIVVGILAILLPQEAQGQEQSVQEFKEYVSGRLGGQLSESQLDEVAKRVDSNGDGTVSEDEFETRMDVIRGVLSGGEDGEMDEQPDGSGEVVAVAPLTNSTDATVLLITGDELAEAWLPFAKWKTANGKLTKIVTVGQINKEFEADNIQEKIRLCVRQHIDEHNTRWVVLGGDCLPNGTGVVPGGHSTVHAQERAGIPTDIVYLSETDWDADDDGIYGEFEDDRAEISYPDGSVGLGRIPVRTADDVAAFTEKVIAYESNYPTDKFATSMIYTCTDQPAYPKVRNSWDGYVSKVWEDGSAGRFFSKETPWDTEGEPGSYPLSAENLVGLINKEETGKLHIHGHGHLPAWVLENSTFSGKHIKQLKNQGAYPLITTVSCNTGEYDSKKDPSIVEQLLRAPNAGSVAIVAPVRTGKPHFAKRSDFRLMVSEGKLDGTTLTMTRYWSHGLGQGATTGHAIMKAKSDMADDAGKSPAYHLCVCELNLLGDPTLDMRAHTPRQPDVTVVTNESDGQLQLTVTTDAPRCTVCVWDSQDVYQVATADDSGEASFEVEAGTNEVTVSVAGASLNSVSKTVAVGQGKSDSSR